MCVLIQDRSVASWNKLFVKNINKNETDNSSEKLKTKQQNH